MNFSVRQVHCSHCPKISVMKDDTTLECQESLAKEKRMVSAVLSLVSWLWCFRHALRFSVFTLSASILPSVGKTPGAGQVSASCLLRAAPANRSLSSAVVGKVRMQWFLSKKSVDFNAVL